MQDALVVIGGGLIIRTWWTWSPRDGLYTPTRSEPGIWIRAPTTSSEAGWGGIHGSNHLCRRLLEPYRVCVWLCVQCACCGCMLGGSGFHLQRNPNPAPPHGLFVDLLTKCSLTTTLEVVLVVAVGQGMLQKMRFGSAMPLIPWLAA